jgi:hypothetical protein
MHRIDELEPVIRMKELVLLLLDQVHQNVLQELLRGIFLLGAVNERLETLNEHPDLIFLAPLLIICEQLFLISLDERLDIILTEPVFAVRCRLESCKLNDHVEVLHHA